MATADIQGGEGFFLKLLNQMEQKVIFFFLPA